MAIGRGSPLVFTAGSVPLDGGGSLVGEGDPAAQTAQVIDNLLAALAAAGAGPDDVVKTTVYVAGGSHEMQQAVWRSVQASPIAAAPSTLVGVPILGHRGQLVEIEAVAVVEEGYRGAVEISAGEEFVVAVQTNASIGWQWDIRGQPDPAVARFVGRDHEADDPESVGSGGTDLFRFRATDPGETTITLTRSYRDEGPDREITVTLRVQAG